MTKKIFLILNLSIALSLNAQIDTTKKMNAVSDIPGLVADTSSLVDLALDDEIDFETNTFKGTRVINSQSI